MKTHTKLLLLSLAVACCMFLISQAMKKRPSAAKSISRHLLPVTLPSPLGKGRWVAEATGNGKSRSTVLFNGIEFSSEEDAGAAFLQFCADMTEDESAVVLLGLSSSLGRGAKTSMVSDGVELLSYVADRGWIARISGGEGRKQAIANSLVFFKPFDAQLRVSPSMYEPCDCDEIPVYVHLVRGQSALPLLDELSAAGFDSLGKHTAGPSAYIAGRVPVEMLEPFLSLTSLHPDVQLVERGAGAKLMNINSMAILQSGSYNGSTPFFEQGIYGSNQIVAVCDTGIDVDSCFFRDTNGTLPPTNRINGTVVDLSLRKVVAANFLYDPDDPADPLDWDSHGHGTRVAGHALGSRIDDPLGTSVYNGMAPGAKLVTQDGGVTTDNCADLPGLGCPVTNFLPALIQAQAQGARIHNNSWGDNENAVFTNLNAYTEACRELDWSTWSNKEFLVVCAAGNSGSANNTVSSPSTAKNGLSVAATLPGSGQESIVFFSSRGWAIDGRIKPDLAAPGHNVTAALGDKNITTTNCNVATGSGTSYSSPMVAGMAALTRDYFAQGFYPTGTRESSNSMTNVSASLVKAVLINCSVHMLNAAARPPSRDQGWGRVDLSRTLLFTNSQENLFVDDLPPMFAGAGDEPYKAYLDVTSTGQPLKVTLVWSDYPATAGAGKQLVNDLDLLVRAPSLSFAGNALTDGWSYHGGGFDRTNNVEQVNWQAPSTGIVEISVWPHAIPEAEQDFAIVVTGDFSLWSLDRDDDGDALPDHWEMFHFGDLSTTATNDSDEDGLSDYGELVAGTDPNDELDLLKVTSFSAGATNNEVVLQWTSEEERLYAVAVRSNLLAGGWTEMTSDIPATEPINTVTLAAPDSVEAFYRIEVE